MYKDHLTYGEIYAEYVIEQAYRMIDYANSVANSVGGSSYFANSIKISRNKIRLNKLKNIFNI